MVSTGLIKKWPLYSRNGVITVRRLCLVLLSSIEVNSAELQYHSQPADIYSAVFFPSLTTPLKRGCIMKPTPAHMPCYLLGSMDVIVRESALNGEALNERELLLWQNAAM